MMSREVFSQENLPAFLELVRKFPNKLLSFASRKACFSLLVEAGTVFFGL